ncbi:hypothetical protein ACFVZP_15845, partial [Streptomyces bottropensis]
MATFTPARALLMLTTGLTCLLMAVGALIGALIGGGPVALGAAVCAGLVGMVGSLIVRRRAHGPEGRAPRGARARGGAGGR